jgi:hypothetical protein
MLESHPSLIRPWSVIIPSQILGVEQGSKPGSVEAFAKVLLVATTSLECWYPELFSFFSPSRVILRTVGPILFSATTVGRHDAALPSSSAVALTSSRPHRLTIVEPRVATTGYIGWFRWPLQPRCGHKKGSPLPSTADNKHRIRPSSTSPSLLFSLQLVLATLPLAHLSHLFHSSPSKLFFRLRPRHQEEARK